MLALRNIQYDNLVFAAGYRNCLGNVAYCDSHIAYSILRKSYLDYCRFAGSDVFNGNIHVSGINFSNDYFSRVVCAFQVFGVFKVGYANIISVLCQSTDNKLAYAACNFHIVAYASNIYNSGTIVFRSLNADCSNFSNLDFITGYIYA